MALEIPDHAKTRSGYRPVASTVAPLPAHPQLLERIAADLDHLHFEADHLLETATRHQIDHLRMALRQLGRAPGALLRRVVPLQQDAIPQGTGTHATALTQYRIHFCSQTLAIGAGHVNLEGTDLAIAQPQMQRGVARRLRDQQDLPVVQPVGLQHPAGAQRHPFHITHFQQMPLADGQRERFHPGCRARCNRPCLHRSTRFMNGGRGGRRRRKRLLPLGRGQQNRPAVAGSSRRGGCGGRARRHPCQQSLQRVRRCRSTGLCRRPCRGMSGDSRHRGRRTDRGAAGGGRPHRLGSRQGRRGLQGERGQQGHREGTWPEQVAGRCGVEHGKHR